MNKYGNICVSLFLFLTLIFEPDVRAIDIDSLLRQTVGESESFEKLAAIESYQATGRLVLNGQAGSFTLSVMFPDKIYLAAKLDGYSLAQAYDGTIAWYQDQNGSISILGGFERKELLRNLYLQTYAFLFPDRFPGSHAYQGEIEKDGQTYHKVSIYPFNNDTVTLFIDPLSGELRFSESRVDNMTTMTTMSDYRTVEGILFPFHSISTTRPVPATSEFTITSMSLNAALDSSIFSVPQTRIADFKFPTDKKTVMLPFEFRRNLIYLTAIINNRKQVRLILDSGASANVFDKTMAEKLELPVVGKMPVIGVAGFDEIDLVKTESVKIGELSLVNQVSGSMDLGILPNAQHDGPEFGGLLGYDFLSRFPVMIDYADSVITIFNPEDFEMPEKGTEVDFYLSRQIPVVEASINGVTGDFIIDLGNAFGIIVHERFARTHKLHQTLDEVRSVAVPLSGVGGATLGKSAKVRRFEIGEVSLSPVRVLLSESSHGLTGSEEIAGNIGSQFLQQFRILFDYNRQKLVFFDRNQSP